MGWKAVGSFVLQHAGTAVGAYGIAVASGASPKEAAIAAVLAAVTGGANHARPQSPIAAPAPPPVDVPPVVASPAVNADAEKRTRVQVLYKQYLNRSRSDITNAEMDEALDLLDAGRENELVRNLRQRAGLPPEG